MTACRPPPRHAFPPPPPASRSVPSIRSVAPSLVCLAALPPCERLVSLSSIFERRFPPRHSRPGINRPPRQTAPKTIPLLKLKTEAEAKGEPYRNKAF
ncbi:hypothetical protein ACHAWF_015003 [Thalassiosira exigua]